MDEILTRVPAEELVRGDVFPSHDDLRHEVRSVEVVEDLLVFVGVEKSDGEHYVAEFPLGHEVQILAYP